MRDCPRKQFSLHDPHQIPWKLPENRTRYLGNYQILAPDTLEITRYSHQIPWKLPDTCTRYLGNYQRLAPDTLEITISTIFSIFEAFLTIIDDIQSNWNVTNSRIWHLKVFFRTLYSSTNIQLNCSRVAFLIKSHFSRKTRTFLEISCILKEIGSRKFFPDNRFRQSKTISSFS